MESKPGQHGCLRVLVATKMVNRARVARLGRGGQKHRAQGALLRDKGSSASHHRGGSGLQAKDDLTTELR